MVGSVVYDSYALKCDQRQNSVMATRVVTGLNKVTDLVNHSKGLNTTRATVSNWWYKSWHDCKKKKTLIRSNKVPILYIFPLFTTFTPSFHPGEQSDLPGVDVLLPDRAGAGVPADRLVEVQAGGGAPVRRALHHHGDAAVDK